MHCGSPTPHPTSAHQPFPQACPCPGRVSSRTGSSNASARLSRSADPLPSLGVSLDPRLGRSRPGRQTAGAMSCHAATPWFMRSPNALKAPLLSPPDMGTHNMQQQLAAAVHGPGCAAVQNLPLLLASLNLDNLTTHTGIRWHPTARVCKPQFACASCSASLGPERP